MENTNRKSRKEFIFIGLGLQVFSLLLGYLFLTFLPYIGWLPALFLTPLIFIVGIIFIFFSKVKLIYKLILSFWIIVVPIGINGEYYYQRQFIQNEAYLIPQNYRGSVSVNFGKSDGISPDLEDKVVILKIDSSGILNTTYIQKIIRREFIKEMESRREFYYVDESGKRSKLKVQNGHPERDSKSKEVLVILEGSEYGNDGKAITKKEFFVGTSSDFWKHFEKKYPNS